MWSDEAVISATSETELCVILMSDIKNRRGENNGEKEKYKL